MTRCLRRQRNPTGIVVVLVTVIRPEGMRAYDVRRFWPMTAEGLSDEGFDVVPVILATVDHAFSKTDEAAIYDPLAAVSSGDARERLHLERVGATGGAGSIVPISSFTRWSW